MFVFVYNGPVLSKQQDSCDRIRYNVKSVERKQRRCRIKMLSFSTYRATGLPVFFITAGSR